MMLLSSPEHFSTSQKLEAVYCLPVWVLLLVICGASQAPGLFVCRRREASVLPGSYQKNHTQKVAASYCLGPQTYLMLYKQ